MAAPKLRNKAFQQLLLLEERVRLSGASLPELNPREYWTAVKCRVAEVNVLLHLHDINEIISQKFLTPLPGCAPWVSGVLNYRGHLLPVYQLSAFFNQKRQSASNAATQVLVVESGAMLCGLLPDEIIGMQKIYQEEERQVSRESHESQVSQMLDKQSATNPLLQFCDSGLSLNDEHWHQLDLIRLAKHLFQINPSRVPKSVSGNAV